MGFKVVIVGSGIVGSSVALHLAEQGWRDVLVVDKGPVVHNDGSTSHAPGGVVALSHNKLLTQMALYGAGRFSSLADYADDRITVNEVGTVDVAVTERRMRDLIRLAGEAKSFGAEAHLLDATETAERVPMLDPSAMEGSIFVPAGQLVASPHLNGAIQREAARNGAVEFRGGVEVVDLEVTNGRVSAVLTDDPEQPRIEAETVVLCTNIWGPVLADRVGVPLPLQAYEHQYVVTGPLPEMGGFDPAEPSHEATFPSVRDLDSALYFRQHWNRYGIGSYLHTPRRVSPHDVGRSAIHDFTPGDFGGAAWDAAQRLFPMFRGLDPSGFPERMNGMFAFSVDGMPIIGPAGPAGLWVAVASWLTHAAGVAKLLTEWMVEGAPEWDPRSVHVARFAGYQTTPAFIRAVCDRNYREVYEILHPRQPPTTPRNVRRTPFDSRHRDLEAEFTVFAGIELPNWYETNRDLIERYAERIPSREGWAAEHWSPIQGAEHLITREKVGLFDLDGLSIIELRGRDAGVFAEHLCANRVDRGVGRIVYTTWLDHRGGVRRDLAVMRVDEDRVWMFVGEGTRPMDLDWVSGHVRSSDRVTVTDVSASMTCLGLWGPNARRVLQRVTSADVSNDAFPFFTGRWIDIGMAHVLALRISYVGELGWELHVPVDAALSVWDALWEAGQDLGIRPVGQGAFDSLRLEKGYPAWGTDVHTEYSAYESGLGWTVRLDKGPFIGSDACRELVANEPDKRWSCLVFEDAEAVAMGGEPVVAAGRCVGYVTSSNHSYSIGRQIAFGYLPADLTAEGTDVDVVWFGARQRAVVTAHPVFDPDMDCLRS